ncbi:hypothetical protein GCM10010954_11960 [Halobacillus andaensis]|uniref:Uncharacterized protein n=2 Tax=Halobacillus andaensis TaxID=1176239 RepID=A0A917B1M1_HALAA|nr:hypothetical protein GCM10010954_11960 [Halobacillus andaensis]
MACGNPPSTNDEENPNSHYKDDEMIGTFLEVNETKQLIEVDISEWAKRDAEEPTTDEGYLYRGKYSDDTELRYEDGSPALLDEIKRGQKLLVNPPVQGDDEGEAEEIVLLDMTYEEKYAEVLSHREDDLKVVVIYENSRTMPSELDERMLEKLDPTPVGSWIEYDEDYVVDYKEEFEIKEFPVILVFDRQELLFKTYEREELEKYFDELEG